MAENCKNVFSNASHWLLKRPKQNVKKEYQNLATYILREKTLYQTKTITKTEAI